MLVNSKQRIAVLASGLVVATSGFVTDEASATQKATAAATKPPTASAQPLPGPPRP